MFAPAESFRVFKARPCIYDLEPSLHKNIGRTREVITLDIVVPSDWVGALRNLWTTGEHTCDCDDEGEEDHTENEDSATGPYGYPCDSKILLYAANTPTYNIDKTFPRGSCNKFVERYRNDIFRLFYNESETVAQQWAQHIQDIVHSTDPFLFVTEEERAHRDEGYIHAYCYEETYKNYTVDLQKVMDDLIYIPDVNHLDHIWYSQTGALGTNSLSKLINNINVGEVLDLLWNYFYHDYEVPPPPDPDPPVNACEDDHTEHSEDDHTEHSEDVVENTDDTTCEDDHAFDPYNTLKLDDELVFPVHVQSIFGYSDKVTLLTLKDDVLYDYHVNIRFKQNVVPTVETHDTNDTTKPIVGESFPPN